VAGSTTVNLVGRRVEMKLLQKSGSGSLEIRNPEIQNSGRTAEIFGSKIPPEGMNYICTRL
jgi:hypothetical protein